MSKERGIGLLLVLLGAAACGSGAPDNSNLNNGLNCNPLAPPGDNSAVVLLGQRVGDDYIDVQEKNDYELQFGHQGGQHLNVWARLYAPEGYEWVLDTQLLDPTTREQLGGRQRRAGVCSEGWTDSDVRLFVERSSTEGPCVLSLKGELFDKDGQVIATLIDEFDVVVTQPEDTGE